MLSQTSFYFEVCLGNQKCDPLKLYEYYVKRRVFAATDGLPEDKEARRNAYKTACKVLEDHFGIDRNSITQRRTTRRKSKRLPLTCPTPDWMQVWLSEEPELVSD